MVKINPLLISSGIIAVLIYSGIVTVPEQSPLVCVIPENNVTYLECQINSNPVKSADKNYIAGCRCFCLKDENSTCYSDGKVQLIFESKLYEKFYPGKLYTLLKTPGNSFLLENGAKLKVKVEYKYTCGNGIPCFKVKEIQECYFDTGLSGKIARFRGLCRLQFKRLMYSWGRAGGLFLALLSGAKEYLDESISGLFRFSGLSHILALSGMHLSLFFSLAGFSQKFSKRKKLVMIIQLLTVCIFVWFAGLSPSLLRALISCVILTLTRFLDLKSAKMINILCMTFLIHFLLRPEDLYSLAFILSYGALSGILFFSGIIKVYVTRLVPDKISGGISASIGAQVITAPVALKVFGFYNPSSILSTLTVSPFVTIFMYSGIALFLMSLLMPFTAQINGTIMNYIYRCIIFLINIWKFIPPVTI